MLERILGFFIPGRTYEVRTSLEFGTIDRSELTQREAFGMELTALSDSFSNIDDAIGKWITISSPISEAVLGDQGRLRKYEQKDIKKLIGAEVTAFHEAATVLLARLRAREFAGMALPYDQRLKTAK